MNWRKEQEFDEDISCLEEMIEEIEKDKKVHDKQEKLRALRNSIQSLQDIKQLLGLRIVQELQDKYEEVWTELCEHDN